MSHIREQTTDIKFLPILVKAAARLGLEADLSAKQFRSYNQSMESCPDGKLSVTGNSKAYEIGLSKNQETGNYNLLFDSYQGGNGLMKVVGKDCLRLVDEYNAELSIQTLAQQGMLCRRSVTADGTVQVVAEG